MAAGGEAVIRPLKTPPPMSSSGYSVEIDAVPGAAPGRTMEVSAELLGQSDDDALRATHEAEPVDVLVLRDLADELGTVAA